MEEQDDIIVLRHFENSIDANLAKTKLDAHGIPCFLTGEELNNIYPLQNRIFGVRLHVFSKDQSLAQDVLDEEFPLPEETVTCPRCRSNNVKVEQTEKLGREVVSLVVSVFKAILFPVPRVYRCQDCRHEF
jgi:hypothetical protein